MKVTQVSYQPLFYPKNKTVIIHLIYLQHENGFLRTQSKLFETETLCVIWYHLPNFKKVKSIDGRVLLLGKVTLLHECFHVF